MLSYNFLYEGVEQARQVGGAHRARWPYIQSLLDPARLAHWIDLAKIWSESELCVIAWKVVWYDG